MCGDWCIWGGCGSSAPFPDTLPYDSFHLAIPELYILL